MPAPSLRFNMSSFIRETMPARSISAFICSAEISPSIISGPPSAARAASASFGPVIGPGGLAAPLDREAFLAAFQRPLPTGGNPLNLIQDV